MQHKTESKDCLIDNENCDNIKTNSSQIIKPRRDSIYLEAEDLDLYYKEGNCYAFMAEGIIVSSIELLYQRFYDYVKVPAERRVRPKAQRPEMTELIFCLGGLYEL